MLAICLTHASFNLFLLFKKDGVLVSNTRPSLSSLKRISINIERYRSVKSSITLLNGVVRDYGSW